MSDLIIKPVDSVHIYVECEESLARELNEYFTFLVPNYQFTPAYKKRKWDGQIRLFNLYSRRIYTGLLNYVIKFAIDRGYSYENQAQDSDTITKESVVDLLTTIKVSSNGETIIPHDHQVKAIYHGLKKKRCLLLSPTGSGKSLIIYYLMRYYLDIIDENKKILIVVPTTGLVSQMYNDFKDYSSKDKWDISKNAHVIFSGQDKLTDKKVVISTWQSIYKMSLDYFKEFSVVFGDECHLFKAKSLTSLMSKTQDCPYKIGTTGTLDGSQTHKLVIEGLFGPVFNVVKTKELMEKELLSNLTIDCITLQYNQDSIKEIKRAKYMDEIKWLTQKKERNDFITNLCCKLKGNTLLLFNYVEQHGIPLHTMIQKAYPNEKVFLIHGGTDTEQRERIRKIVDTESQAILVASYGTCSTGINIRNINNVVFGSPSKSVVRVLQSIGRGLRKTKTKDKVKLYDISDDLSHKSYKNHTLRHLDERIKIYTNEEFKFDKTNVRIEGDKHEQLL